MLKWIRLSLLMKKKNSFSLDLKLLNFLLSYIKNYPFFIFISLLALIISHITSALHPFLVKRGIDVYIAKGDSEGLLSISLWLLLVVSLSFLFTFLFTFLTELLGQKLLYQIRLDIFKKILGFTNSLFDRTPVGKLLTNITSDVEAIRQFIGEGILTIIGDILKILIIIIAMFLINWRLSLVNFMVFPLFIFFTWSFRASIRMGFRKVRESNSQINRVMVETLTGIKEVQLFNAVDEIEKKFDRSNDMYLKGYLKVVKAQAMYFPTIDVISNLSMGATLLFMSFYMREHVEVGDFYAFFTFVNMIFMPLRNLAEKFNIFQSALAASERVLNLLETEDHLPEPVDPIIPNGKIKGELEFKKVCFSYQEKQKIIDRLSLKIKAGKKLPLLVILEQVKQLCLIFC